jgi:FixJ family two-component response regulator
MGPWYHAGGGTFVQWSAGSSDAHNCREQIASFAFAEEQANRVSLLSSGQKTTVIVIDDDVFVCRALKTQLEILGFNVLVFQNADGLLASELPISGACLLSDVYLPGMNGIELCRHLAKAGLRLPTILMTGRDDEHTRRRMREARPIACLFKPFDEAALLRAIRKAIRQCLKPEY